MDGVRRNNDKLIEMIETAAKFAKLESVTDIQLEIMDIGAILRNVAGHLTRSSLKGRWRLPFELKELIIHS